MLKAIWAQDKNGLIGKDNRLPWHLPNDLKFFKEQTNGHTIVMGRKTFEGMGSRPLPGRRNLVLTGNPAKYNNDKQPNNLWYMSEMDSIVWTSKLEDIYITGGKKIYTMFMPYIDELIITQIAHAFEGDTYMDIDLSDFELYKANPGLIDEDNQYLHTFCYYHRKK